MVAVGDVYSVRVGPRVGLCRVVASEKPLGSWDKNGRWRVVTCEWVGDPEELAAALERAETFAPVRLERLKGKRHVQSIGGPPPPSFEHVGVHPPDAADRRLRSPRNPGAWEWVPHQLSVELEYRADPVEFEAARKRELREQRAERAAELKRERAKKRARPKSLVGRDVKTLASLGEQAFVEWTSHPPGFVTAVRAEVKSLAVALGHAKGVSGVSSCLKKTTIELNGIDREHDHAFMTPDVEELVEVLVGLAAAAGLDTEYAAQTIDALREF